MINFTKDAEQDLEGIYTYISKDDENAALKQIQHIHKKINLLEFMQNIGAVYKRLRFLVCDSYKIFYKLDTDAITIIRILHGKMSVEKNLK